MAERLLHYARVDLQRQSNPKAAYDHYRALLDMSNAGADQATRKALLHRARGILSSIPRLHGAALSILILDNQSENLKIFEFDRDSDLPNIEAGTKLLRIGTVARVIDEHEPVILETWRRKC